MVVLLGVFLSIAGATRAAPARSGWSVAPPPQWVRPFDLPVPKSAAPKARSESGKVYLLLDHQVRLGPEAWEYQRLAWTPLSTGAVQNASEIQIHFDPSYERLVIHHVRLLRNGRDVFAFTPGDVRLIQQETDLDQQIYSGELTAVIFLRDLRAGDTVDYAYSTQGTNPIIGGGYDTELPLAYDSPVRELRHVIQAPTSATLHISPRHTTLQPRVEAAGGWRSYAWALHDVAAAVSDEDEPGWYDPDPRVEVSTFESWGAVARWAQQLFDEQLQSSPALLRLAGEFRRAPGGQAAWLAAATRFVQDEVRYLGVEMGPSSHQPHPPDQVLEQRFGDCKDKSLLLVALLRELGVDAAPALVDTERGRGLDDTQASPFAFDHAIVQARLGDRTLWIDATESDKGGSPLDWEPPPFERALVLRPGTDRLTTIPVPQLSQPTLEVTETYTLGSHGTATRLDVVTTYRRQDADAMRQKLATTSSDELAKDYLDFYAREHSDIKAIGSPVARDDRDGNVLTMTEAYELGSFWKDGTHELRGWQVREDLPGSVPSTRTTPLAVAHPVRVLHRLVVRATSAFDLGRYGERIADHAFVFTSDLKTAGNEMRLSYEYRSQADSVPPGKLKGHVASIDRVRNALVFVLASDLTSPDAPSSHAAVWLAGGVGGVVGAGAVWGLLRRRASRRGPQRAGASQPPAGRSAGTALVAATDAAFVGLCTSRPCRCGGTSRTVVDRVMAAYDGRRLTVLRLGCPACGAEEDVYGRVGDEA